VSLIPPAIRIRFIKQIDSLIGKPAGRLLPAPPDHPDIKVRSILILRPGGIGDALLLAPAINSLRATYACACITILAEKRNAGAFSLIPAVDRLLLYDRPADLLQFFRSRYDLIIDTEQWHRLSAVLTRIVSSRVKIGFATNERSRLFTRSVPYSHDEYEARSFLNLLLPLQIKSFFDSSLPFLTIPDSAASEAACLLKSIASPYITLFPGASIRERRWGSAKFATLAEQVASLGFAAVIIGGKEDKAAGEAIIAGSSGLNLAGRTSIAVTAAIIAGSRLLVSGDSGILHIGAGLGIPTVSFFGAGIAKKWSPQGGKHIVLNRNLTCSPCTLFGTTPVCRYGVRCLEDIDAAAVYEAVHKLLMNEVKS
jgi:ADP-heptose:LPS heptosyltransferase